MNINSIKLSEPVKLDIGTKNFITIDMSGINSIILDNNIIEISTGTGSNKTSVYTTVSNTIWFTSTPLSTSVSGSGNSNIGTSSNVKTTHEGSGKKNFTRAGNQSKQKTDKVVRRKVQGTK